MESAIPKALFALAVAICSPSLGQSKRKPIPSKPKPRLECKLHHKPLKDGFAPVVFRYCDIGRESWDYEIVEKKLFPMARSYVWAQNSDNPSKATKRALKYCPSCRWVEAKWIREWKPRDDKNEGIIEITVSKKKP